VKKEDMTEGRKAGRASKTKPGPPLSSKSGSASDSCVALCINCCCARSDLAGALSNHNDAFA